MKLLLLPVRFPAMLSHPRLFAFPCYLPPACASMAESSQLSFGSWWPSRPMSGPMWQAFAKASRLCLQSPTVLSLWCQAIWHGRFPSVFLFVCFEPGFHPRLYMLDLSLRDGRNEDTSRGSKQGEYLQIKRKKGWHPAGVGPVLPLYKPAQQFLNVDILQDQLQRARLPLP